MKIEKNVHIGHFGGQKVKFWPFFVNFAPFNHQMKENIKINQFC